MTIIIHIRELDYSYYSHSFLKYNAKDHSLSDAEVTLLTIYDKEDVVNVSDNYVRWLLTEAKK